MSVRIRKLPAALMAGLVFWMGAAWQAASAHKATGAMSASVGAIMRLHSEHFLLKQEVANALLRHQLQKLAAEGATSSSASPGSSSAGPGGMPFVPAARHIGKTLPRIRSIFGTGTRLRAILEARNGAVLSVHAGSPLPGGLLVRRISSRAVWVSLGARSRLLFLHWAPAHKVQSTKLSGGGYLPNAALQNLLLNHPPQGMPSPASLPPMNPPPYHAAPAPAPANTGAGG